MAFFPFRSRWIRHRIWIYSVVYSPSPLLLLFPLFNRGNSRIKLILCICFSLSVTFLSTIWWFGSFRIFYSPFYFFYIPFSYKCHAWEKKKLLHHLVCECAMNDVGVVCVCGVRSGGRVLIRPSTRTMKMSAMHFKHFEPVQLKLRSIASTPISTLHKKRLIAYFIRSFYYLLFFCSIRSFFSPLAATVTITRCQ